MWLAIWMAAIAESCVLPQNNNGRSAGMGLDRTFVRVVTGAQADVPQAHEDIRNGEGGLSVQLRRFQDGDGFIAQSPLEALARKVASMGGDLPATALQAEAGNNKHMKGPA